MLLCVCSPQPINLLDKLHFIKSSALEKYVESLEQIYDLRSSHLRPSLTVTSREATFQVQQSPPKHGILGIHYITLKITRTNLPNPVLTRKLRARYLPPPRPFCFETVSAYIQWIREMKHNDLYSFAKVSNRPKS